MQETTKRFLKYLEDHNIRYDSKEREGQSDWVCVRYQGDNADTISLQFFFSRDGGDVAVRIFSIARVPKNKTAAVLEVLNALMIEYRWLRFYLDSDNEVTAAIDAVITEETAAPVAGELLARGLNIVDDIYPRIMKVLWA